MSRATFNEHMKGMPPASFLRISIRFHIERRCGKGLTAADDQWSRETLAGAKTITAARRDLAEIKRDSPSYFSRRLDFRIVRITTTTEIVK